MQWTSSWTTAERSAKGCDAFYVEANFHVDLKPLALGSGLSVDQFGPRLAVWQDVPLAQSGGCRGVVPRLPRPASTPAADADSAFAPLILTGGSQPALKCLDCVGVHAQGFAA